MQLGKKIWTNVAKHFHRVEACQGRFLLSKKQSQNMDPKSMFAKSEFGGYNKFPRFVSPQFLTSHSTFFSCQNVHYKAFHCKHELDT